MASVGHKPNSQVTQRSLPTYSQGHSASAVASHQSRTVQNSALFLVPHIQPSFTIVDLGCGPGTITQGFCGLVPNGKVIGVDASDTVIALARSSAPSTTFANLEFLVGDITARLPFDDNTVDVVYTHQTLCHIPDPVGVMKEAFRILKPGGILASREYDHMTWHPSLPGLQKYTETMSQRMRASGATGSGSGRRLHAWAAEAGFDRTKMLVDAGTTCHVADEARWWAGVHIGRLETEIGASWLENGDVASQDEIDAIIADFRKWADDDQAWYVNVHGEIIARK